MEPQTTPYTDVDAHTFKGRVFNTFQQTVSPSIAKIRSASSFIGNAELLPQSVSLRSKMDDVYNQEDIGSCTSNSVCTCMRYTNPGFSPSRLFLYYNARKAAGDEASDSGSSVYGNIQSAAQSGVCTEKTWPYIPSKFTQKPPTEAYVEAETYQLLKWSQVAKDLTSIKACLYAGFPFTVGLTVYDSLFKAESHPFIMPMPNPEKDQHMGGHAVVICGYDDSKRLFELKNSWDTTWADGGYCYLPYEYLLGNLAWDFWQVNKMETGSAPTPAPLPEKDEDKAPSLLFGNLNQTVKAGKFYTFQVKVENNDKVKRNLKLTSSIPDPLQGKFLVSNKALSPDITFTTFFMVMVPINIEKKVYPINLNVTCKETGLSSSLQLNLEVIKA